MHQRNNVVLEEVPHFHTIFNEHPMSQDVVRDVVNDVQSIRTMHRDRTVV